MTTPDRTHRIAEIVREEIGKAKGSGGGVSENLPGIVMVHTSAILDRVIEELPDMRHNIGDTLAAIERVSELVNHERAMVALAMAAMDDLAGQRDAV